MSTPEVGSAFVRLNLDPGDFEEQIKDTVESGAQEAQKTLDDQVSKQAQAITDLRTRAEAAALRSLSAQGLGNEGLAAAEQLSAGLLNLQANIAQAQFAAEETLRSAATAMGAEREQLLAAAEAYKVAAQIGQDTLDRSRRAGRIVDPNVPGQGGGILDRVGEFARASGRTGGLGGLAAVGARLGVIGFAATAAFQAVGELQQSLRVTGDEAFTTEGKIRNLGAELLGGNIVGGIKALTAVRKADLVGGLGEAVAADIAKQKAKTDELVITEEKLNAVRQQGRDELVLYVRILELQGHLSEDQADALIRVSDQMERQKAIVEASATAYANYQQAVEQAGGSLERAFGPDSRGGLRGPGGVEANRPITAGTPVFEAGTGGTDVAARIRASITSRIQDAEQRAQLELRDALIQQKLAKQAFDTAKEVAQSKNQVDGAAKEWAAYVEATTDVKNATVAAKNATEAAATAAQDAAAIVRDAQAARIVDDGARLAAELKNAQIVERQKKAALDRAKGETEIAKANAAYEQAVTSRVLAQQAIIDRNKQAAADALTEKQANEQARLANQAARAAATTGLKDDIAVAKETRDYYLELARTLDGSAQKQAIGAAIEAGERVKQLRADQVSQRATERQERQALAEAKLNNRLALAGLTERKSDDLKVVNEQIAYYRALVKGTEGLEKEQNRAKLIAARARKQALEGIGSTDNDRVTAFDLLKQFSERFSGGNLINADQPFVGPTGFVADVAQFLRRQQSDPMAGAIGATEKNTAAIDRLTEAFLRNDEVHNPQRRTAKSGAVAAIERRWSEAGATRAYIEAHGG